MWWTASCVFQVINKPYRFAVYGVASAFVSVLLSYFFANIWGLIGAAIGYTVMDVIMAMLVLPYVCQCLGMVVIDLEKSKK